MSINRNTLALIYTGLLFLGFFISGLFEVLDYFIIKALLFSGFLFLGIILFWMIIKHSKTKKNTSSKP
jgi:hypothetical protein